MTLLKNKAPRGASDMAKSLVILGLPFVHSIILFLGYEAASEALYSVAAVGALIIFGAPTFLTCLGIDLCENRSAQGIIKLGVQILIIALCLNFVRFVIPDSIQIIAGVRPVVMLIIEFLACDVYNFIGLFCIFYGLAKKYGCSQGLFTLISVVLFAIDEFIAAQGPIPIPVVNAIVGNFCSGQNISGDGGNFVISFFSLMGWSIFPCVGMYIGKAMKLEKKKRNCIFGAIYVASIVVFVVHSMVLTKIGTNVVDVLTAFAFHRTYSIKAAVPMLCLAMFVIMSLYFLYELLPQNRVEKTLIEGSRLVLPFYLIHYVIMFPPVIIYLYSMRYFVGKYLYAGVGAFLAVAIVVEVLTIFICYKKGFTFARWLFRVTDYTRWGKKKKSKTLQNQ